LRKAAAVNSSRKKAVEEKVAEDVVMPAVSVEAEPVLSADA
jgi:hypothetical protein